MDISVILLTDNGEEPGQEDNRGDQTPTQASRAKGLPDIIGIQEGV